MARNYFILLISFLGAVALADYAIVSGLFSFQSPVESPTSPNAEVLYKLAQKYEMGVEVEKDINKAIYWYQVAAENGSIDAKERLIALNIPLDGSNTASSADKKTLRSSTNSKDIDAETRKITNLLEKQLAKEASKSKKSRDKKNPPSPVKSKSNTIKPVVVSKPKIIEPTQSDEDLETSESVDTTVNALTTRPAPTPRAEQQFDASRISDDEPESAVEDMSSQDTSENISVIETFDSDNIPKPQALQPARPLNLPAASTSSPGTFTPAPLPNQHITGYDEDADIEEVVENPTLNEDNEPDEGTKEKKKFNVNPCNGPAAKFMSTCR